MPQRDVEELRRPVARALLRPEHLSSTVLAHQRVRDVDGEAPAHLARPRVQPRQVEGRDGGQPLPAVGHLLAPRIEKTSAQAGQDAGTTVGGRGTPEADQDLRDTGVERGTRDVPGAAGARVQWLQRCIGDPWQAARLSELDDRGAPVGRHGPPGRRRPTDRVHRLGDPRLPAPDGEQRVEGALTAVGHGQAGHDGVRGCVQHPVGDGGRDLGSGQTALERVGTDNDVQRLHALIVGRQGGQSARISATGTASASNAWATAALVMCPACVLSPWASAASARSASRQPRSARATM